MYQLLRERCLGLKPSAIPVIIQDAFPKMYCNLSCEGLHCMQKLGKCQGGLWQGDDLGQTRVPPVFPVAVVAPGSHTRAATAPFTLRRKQTPPWYALGGTQGQTKCPVVVEPLALTGSCDLCSHGPPQHPTPHGATALQSQHQKEGLDINNLLLG